MQNSGCDMHTLQIPADCIAARTFIGIEATRGTAPA